LVLYKLLFSVLTYQGVAGCCSNLSWYGEGTQQTWAPVQRPRNYLEQLCAKCVIRFDAHEDQFDWFDAYREKKLFSKMCFLPILHIFIVNGVIYADKILRCLFDSVIATPLYLLYGKSPIIVVLQAFCATLYRVNCFQFFIFFLSSVTK